MSRMFSGYTKLEKINLGNMQTNKVTDMSYLFQDNRALKSIDLSKFNFENVKNFERMFSTCQSLTTIDLSNLKNSKAETQFICFFIAHKLQV